MAAKSLTARAPLLSRIHYCVAKCLCHASPSLVTGVELVRAMQRLGWVVVVQRGAHVQLKHAVRGDRVTVPVHAGKVLGPGLLRAILRQTGVDADEMRRNL